MRGRCRFTSLILVALLSIVSASPARAEVITLVTDEWCPYNCTPNTQKQGVLIEIAQKAFAKHNITIEYKITPWTRAISDTRMGKYNAIVGASLGDAPDFIFPATPQASAQMAFFVKAGSAWRYTGLDSLKAVSLGTIRDYAYGEPVDTYVRTYRRDMKKIQQVSGDTALDANIKKLLLGRMDAVIEDQNVMLYALASQKREKAIIKAGDLPVTKDNELFLAFSPAIKESRKYADILSQETIAMRKSGELDKLVARYGLIPEPNKK